VARRHIVWNLILRCATDQQRIFTEGFFMYKNLHEKTLGYNPYLGFIGQSQIDVANYIFSGRAKGRGHRHSENLAKFILSRSVEEQYEISKKLTKFLKKRDLTFSKSDENGEYKIFTVPCTTSVVPLPKSVFNQLEQAAQVFVTSLRLVLQDIYGSNSVEESVFVKSLPAGLRETFIHAVKTSPNYFTQLHNPSMKEYPFFDNVGFDLVLIEDYLGQEKNITDLLEKKDFDNLPHLPFKILELNAGSPSGASNNMNILEGLDQLDSKILQSVGPKVMPNDHFDRLASTFKSLGEYWTNIKDGVQVLLPPGGSNGASPEIHQLAAYSGLIYVDPVQLYCDEVGHIRMRTVTGSNPKVSAIYSRINSDSALFDKQKGVYMKDAESGEMMFMRDPLVKDENGEGVILRDGAGNPIPMESCYAIPGAVEAIVNRKLYMGGLNRVLDNKIILATLTKFAPEFFREKIQKLGVNVNALRLDTPESLPSEASSIAIIEKNPEEWVIKRPNLSGGTGVYILKTLTRSKQLEILAMIKAKPTEFAYQKVVKIARIPFAKESKGKCHLANVAADIRMWVFYGAGEGALPKISHNALVRTAPTEKGKMSSIVNTSKGGGYAPFVVIDDVNDPRSVTINEMLKPIALKGLSCDLPTFVAAQIIQVARMSSVLRAKLTQKDCDAISTYLLIDNLKEQCREIISFINPRSMEKIYDLLEMTLKNVSKRSLKDYFLQADELKTLIVATLNELQSKNLPLVSVLVEELKIFNVESPEHEYLEKDRKDDLTTIYKIASVTKTLKNEGTQKLVARLSLLLKKLVKLKVENTVLSSRTKNIMLNILQSFEDMASAHLRSSSKTADFASIFGGAADLENLRFETLYLGRSDSHHYPVVATRKEFITNKRLADSSSIDADLKEARVAWLKIESMAKKMSKVKAEKYLADKRKVQFEKFPCLKRYQELIFSTTSDVDSLIEILPILPYAKYNIEKFAKLNDVSVRELFTDTLKPNRLGLLPNDEINRLGLGGQHHGGECFAKKRKSHGLFSDSDIFIWIRKEQDPFTLIYTAGHELIHYQQIKEAMKLESSSIAEGSVSFAKFLNYYGNFLCGDSRSYETFQYHNSSERRPLFGLDEMVESFPQAASVKKSVEEIQSGNWDNYLKSHGSLLGLVVPASVQVRVKALREIIPALENAKNIRFAKECGLVVPYDEIRSALPTATDAQIKIYRPVVERALSATEIDYEAMRVIGSHQYFGVRLSKVDVEKNTLVLRPKLRPIAMGNSYNQTQQQ